MNSNSFLFFFNNNIFNLFITCIFFNSSKNFIFRRYFFIINRKHSKINSSQSTISMNLYSFGFFIITSKSFFTKII